MDDLFELQDDIVASIASSVGPEITLAEIERARVKRPDALDAWDLFLRAKAGYHRMTKQDVEAAIADLERRLRSSRNSPPRSPCSALSCACRNARMGPPGAPAFREGPRLRRTSSSSMADEP
jgi:hypothetical protein